MKKYWLINVNGSNGYSMVVHYECDDIEDAIKEAALSGLFEDEEDAIYASGEEADDYTIKHFKEHDLIIEL